MKGWPIFLAGLVLIACCGCAKQGGVAPLVSKPDPAQPPVSKPVPPVLTLDRLSCAEIDNGPPQMILYQSASLYQNGAVLPTKQGLACLETLASWLTSSSQSRWQVTVGAEAVAGFEPLVIATKRQELLLRFFARKGIEMQDWQWFTTAEPGAQLVLQPVTDSP